MERERPNSASRVPSYPIPASIDALREVANIGSGHAATALSDMMGGKLVWTVTPHVRDVTLADIPELFGDPEQVATLVYVAISGDVRGHLTFWLPSPGEQELVKILTDGLTPGSEGPGDWDRSVLAEWGNVLSGSFLTTLSDLTGWHLVPSVPLLATDVAGALLSTVAAMTGLDAPDVPLIDTRFDVSDHSVMGHLAFILHNEEIDRLWKALAPD